MTARQLDPYLVAALVNQESDVRRCRAFERKRHRPDADHSIDRPPLHACAAPGTLHDLDADPPQPASDWARHTWRTSKRFGSPHLALAGYNAGPHRVAQWLAERPGVEPEEFVDDIPFPETQAYVRKVLGTANDYRRLYGGSGATATEAGPGRPRPASPKASPPKPAATAAKPAKKT